jgi:hypothetical protein
LNYGTFMSWFKLESKGSEQSGQFVALPEIWSGQEATIIFPNGIRLHYRGALTGELIQLLQNA